MKRKITILLTLTIGIIYIAKSQIIYTDINPDKTTTGWEVFTFHLANPTAGYLNDGTINIWIHPTPEVVILSGADCQVMVNNVTAKFAMVLQAGDSISSTKKWADVSYDALNVANSQGLWIGGVIDKYLGIRFKLTSGGNWLYGWARLDVDATPNSFTVKDYAYESTPNKAILAGDITGISESNLLNNISIYFHNKTLFVDFKDNNTTNGIIKLYNLTGQEIKSLAIDNNKMEINVGEIPFGIYFIKIFADDRTFTGKIILQ